jgi:hypothetical protein
MRIIVSSMLVTLLLTLPVLARAALVSCSILGPGAGATCPDPIAQGTVDGQWVGVIEHFNGTNGGPDKLETIAVGYGGNGPSSVVLGEILTCKAISGRG